MNDNDIYLIYINKGGLNNNFKLNNFIKYEDNEYIYYPFFVKDLKDFINKNKEKLKIQINNKKESKDTWESAYTLLNIKDIYNLVIDFDNKQKVI